MEKEEAESCADERIANQTKQQTKREITPMNQMELNTNECIQHWLPRVAVALENQTKEMTKFVKLLEILVVAATQKEK